MSGHQPSLNHHHHHHSHPQQQQQAATSSSSRLGLPATAGTEDSTVPGYPQQVAGIDGGQYPRAMCAAAAAYNGEVTPTAAHQGPTSLPTVGGYNPTAFGGSRVHNASATPGHAALGGPTAHATAAASYCMPMGQSADSCFTTNKINKYE